jgi:nucleoid-associated protein YejK
MKNTLGILIYFLVVTILFSACPQNVENTSPEYTISTKLESLSILSGSGTELVRNFDSKITGYTIIAIDSAPDTITVTGTPAYY